MPEPFLKYYFPVFHVSEESGRERGARFPPLFYLHLWWARRPLIGSRTTTAALLVDVDGEPSQKFISEFLSVVRLEPQPQRPAYNYDPNRTWIRQHSKAAQARLLDVFAGGGSIPFEALRLGVSEVIAVEYNPVAYIILKATLEYPLRYRERLVRDVKKWAERLVNNVRKELKEYYPQHPRGRPTSYIWVRVYRCPDGKLVPSISNPLLSRDMKIALKLAGFKDNEPLVEIVSVNKEEEAKNYATIKFNQLQCPRGVLSAEELRRQYREAMETWEKEGRYGYHPAILAAVKLENNRFVKPTSEMLKAYQKAEETLQQKWDMLLSEDLIPIEDHIKGDADRIYNYGINKFYKMFNARQLLVHATMVKYIREAYQQILRETRDEEYAKAVTTYLALGHGKLLDYNSAITTWDPQGKGSINHVFHRHAYIFGDDYAEGDIIPGTRQGDLLHWVFFSNTGVVRALERIVELLRGVDGKVEVVLGDATDPSLYAGIGSVDFVVTDPPYYANVQYGELSDYFYVWWKRSIGELYPEAFSTELTPKDEEIVVNRIRGKGNKWFEERIRTVFELVRENLRPGGRVAVMYAHRSSEGLIAMLRALLDAGLTPFAVWSFASEQPRSIHLVGKAAVRSLLVIGLEPREGNEGGLWDARLQKMVVDEAERTVNEVLDYGLSYIDALLAAVGRGFNIVGKRWPLQTIDGKKLDFEEIVRFVYRAAIRALARRVLRSEIDAHTMMYLLARVVYSEPEYDDLRRLGYALGIDHNQFIKTYAKSPRRRKDAKVYPIKPLTEVEAPASTLVGIIANTVKAYKRGGHREALDVVSKSGYSICDESLVRFVETLLADIESSGDKWEDARALRGIYELITSRCNVGNIVRNSKQKSLYEFIKRKR